MAALSGKVAVDVVLADCPADKFWEGIKNSHVIYPKIFPEDFKSIEIIQGDGGVGSLKKIVFTDAIPHINTVIEKLTAFDDASKTLTYTLVDGDLLKFFKAFSGTIQVAAKGDGSIVNWSLVYEKVNEEPPSPNVFAEKAKNGFEKLAAYLVNN